MNFTKTTLAFAISFASSASIAQLQELETTKVKGDTEQSQTAISALKIEQNLVSNLKDLVRDIPGVVTKSSDTRWGGTGFNIRGVADDRIAVSIDGLEQGESLQYEGGQAYGYFKGGRNGLELETMKKVTITKGANSVISGSGALGGSVQFTTKDADDFLEDKGDDWGGKLSTSYGSASASVMGSLSGAARVGQFEALAIITQREGHELENHTAGADIEGSGRERPDEQDRDVGNVFLKLNYDFSDTHTLGLVLEDYSQEIFTDAKSYNGAWYVDRKGDDTRERQRFGIFHKIELDGGIFDRLEWAIDKQNIDFEAKTPQSVTFYGGLTPRVDTRSFDQELSQLKIDFSKQVVTGNTTHDIFYGAAYTDKQVDNTQTRVQTKAGEEAAFSVNQALIPGSDIESYNVFVLDRISLGDDTSIDVGIRYDDYQYSAKANENFTPQLGEDVLGGQDFDFFSGAVGIKQALNDNFRLEVKLGRAFRAPTIENLYTRSGSEENWRTGPNPNLSVETATNFEVTLEGVFDSGRFSITPFFNKYQDFIESQERIRINSLGEVDDYSVASNVGGADIKGVEISASLDLNKAFGAPKGLSLYFSSAYAEGEQDNGDPLTSIQPLNVRTNLSFTSEDRRWGINTSVGYTAAKEASDAYSTADDGSRTERDYLSNSATVLDVTGFYNVTEQLTVRGGFFNLTDKEYYSWDGIRFVGRDDLRPGIGVRDNGISRFTEPGRNFTLRADYRF